MMLEQHDVTYYPYIAFEKYIGDNMFLPYNGIYYILFPILAVLPFGTSLVRDEQLHYTRNILVRQSKRRYFWQNTSPHMSAVPLQCYYR